MLPTAEEIVALTDETKDERILPPLPAARLAVTFADRTLADSARVIEQVGADTLARSTFRKNAQGGSTLDAARLPSGQQGVCLRFFLPWKCRTASGHQNGMKTMPYIDAGLPSALFSVCLTTLL